MKNKEPDVRRLFLGLPATNIVNGPWSDAVKRLEINAKQKNMDFRWIPAENYHVTIKFLGSARIESCEFRRILSGICHDFAPIKIECSDIGGFPSSFNGRVIWLGIKKSRFLVEFQRAVEEKLVDSGFEAEEKPFQPHITVARTRKQRNVTDLISPFRKKKWLKWKATQLSLYESHLQNYFPLYTPLESWPLCRVDEDQSSN